MTVNFTGLLEIKEMKKTSPVRKCNDDSCFISEAEISDDTFTFG
jgi:hypothetical protein